MKLSEIRIGQRVKAIKDFEGYPTKNKIGFVRRINISSVGVEFDENVNGHELDGLAKKGNGLNIDADHLELDKAYKPKPPTHLVIWDEGRDPYQFFTSKADADAKIEELKTKPSVKMDSIVIVEIKTVNNVVFKPTLEQYKI